MSSISSVSGYSALSSVYLQSNRASQRSQTDEQTVLPFTQATRQGTATTSSNAVSSSDLYASLDTDGDGTVTEQEFSDKLSSVLEELSSQLDGARPQGGPSAMGGMPPPPPPQNTDDSEDTGFTVDELSAQLEEIGSTDETRASFLSNVIENFDDADSDGDGKVTFKEAMALQESQSAAATATDEDSSAATTTTTVAEDDTNQLLAQILKLAQTYGLASEQNALSRLSLNV